MRRLCLVCVVLSCAISSFAQDIDYGADIVNAMKEQEGMVKGGGRTYDYLALRNHQGPSGVPLGGIGTGYFDISPEGCFTRIALNNTHEDGVLKDIKGSFLALWDGEKTSLLQLKNELGFNSIQNITYTGLFPTIRCDYGNGVTMQAYSGLVPHNIKDSSLPVVWFDVTIQNTTGSDREFSVALSWEDIISRGLFDVEDPSVFAEVGNNAWGLNTIRNKYPEKDFKPLHRVDTRVVPIQVGRFTGLLQCADEIVPHKFTYQNYVNQVAILGETRDDVKVSFLPAWQLNDSDAWSSFRANGEFSQTAGDRVLHHAGSSCEMASVISIKTKVKTNEQKTVRFMLVWYMPELKTAGVDSVRYFGAADYGRYFHNYFGSIKETISYAASERARILTETQQWQLPVLTSTLPDWLKFKLINSGYVIYTNSILNKAGDFAVMEGLMGGLTGTMDQRLMAHPFYQKFFTALDRSEMELFGRTPGTMGQILHFNGNYYLGIASRDGQTPAPDGWMLDNSGGWLIQLAKDYQQTGDLAYIEQFRNNIKGAVAFLKSRIRGKIEIPDGFTTYDDFWHPEIYIYTATTYPVFMEAAAILAEALGEKDLQDECLKQKERSIQDAVRYLWNGEYFAYGCDVDGSNRRDDVMFSGQLAGQFISQYCRWNCNFSLDMTRSSLLAQFRTNVGKSIDYYAPKAWNMADQGAMIWEHDGRKDDSTCWPFYLESYTAMAAIQAGFVEDGLKIMEYIQLVHLRNGWTWTQNLWRPGEATYMTAPVTWFVTDVLAGAGVDVTNNTLFLAPVIGKGKSSIKLPLFYPKFWAVVTLDPGKKTAMVDVIKTFGKGEVTINKLVCRPVGRPANEEKVFSIKPFQVRAGESLDLSTYYEAMTAGRMHEPVLK